MRILLSLPTFSYKFRYPAPFGMSDFSPGVAYVASALKAAGHEVYGLNPNNHFEFGSAKEMLDVVLTRRLQEVKPELIGLGGLCTDYAWLRDSISICRRECPEAPVMVGGGITTYDGEFIMQKLKPDFAFNGEAERAVVALAQELPNGRSLGSVPNLLWWKNGRVQANSLTTDYGDINSLLFPDYEIFQAHETLDSYSLANRYFYRYPKANPRPVPLISGRSCPFACTFCVHERRVDYRTRSTENLEKEMAFMFGKYRFNLVIILDELFCARKDRLEEFSQMVLEGRRKYGWDFAWSFQTHARANLDEKAVALARAAGCYFFSYGMESASQRVLDSMHKRSNPQMIVRAIETARKCRVGFVGGFIFGDPAEDAGTVKETLGFLSQHCQGVHLALGSVTPFPGSSLHELCHERRLIADQAEFYETIEERRYNMCGMKPERLWFAWCALAGYLGNEGLWHKSARARARVSERFSRFEVIDLAAICPSCKAAFVYRHLVTREYQKNQSLGLTYGFLVRVILKLRQYRFFARLLIGAIRLIALAVPWYKELCQLAPRYRGAKNSIITGCPHCNECVRLEWEEAEPLQPPQPRGGGEKN